MRKRPYFDLPVAGYTHPVLRVSALAGGVECEDIANGVMLEFRLPDGRGEGSWVVDRDSMLMLLRAIEGADDA